MRNLFKDTADEIRIFLTDSDDVAVTGASVTVTLLKKGQTSFAAGGGTVTEVGNGWYIYYATTTDTNTYGSLGLRAVAVGAVDFNTELQVIYDNPYAIKGVNATQISGDSDAADNLELDYDGTGYAKTNSTIGTCTTNTDMRGTDGAITSLTGIATATNISDLQTHGDSNWATATGFSTLTAQNVWEYEYRTITGAVDANVVQLSSSTTAATKLAISAGLIYTGTIEAGTTNSILVTDLSPSTDNVFEGKPLIMATGTLKAKVGAITAYNGTTKTLTVEGFEVAPNIGDTFIIL